MWRIVAGMIAATMLIYGCSTLKKVLASNANECLEFSPPVVIAGRACSKVCVAAGTGGAGVAWSCVDSATGTAVVVK